LRVISAIPGARNARLIERRHRSLKSQILLENCFLPGDFERQVAAFVDHYNDRRYQASLGV